MTDQAPAEGGKGARPLMSDSLDPIHSLLRMRALGPPSNPGVLASLDRFEILRLIGVGGMGVVLLARDTRTGQKVAVKLLKPELSQAPQAVRRFLKEAGHMRRMSHPGLLPVLEVSDRSEGPYFVMPFLDRGSLAQLIRPGQPLNPEMILTIAKQVAEALSYAHSKGIIHRDLKPGNILLDAEGRAYVSDFGLARTMFNDSITDVRTSQCEGTAPYMSPAVAAGEAEDTRCDVYALGTVLYEMLTGQPAYTGQSTQEVLSHITAGPPPPIAKLAPDAPKGLVRIAEGAMARELRERYAHMKDVVSDLERVAKGKAPRGPHGGGRLKRAMHEHRRVRWILRVALVILLAYAVAVLVYIGWALFPVVFPRGEAVKGSASRPILVDKFDDPKIDGTLWKWGQTDAFSPGLTGGESYRIVQEDGILLIESAVKPSGVSSCQTTWVDSRVDLKRGGDVAIDVELSGKGTNGFLAIVLTDGSPPKNWSLHDPACVQLFRAQGDKNYPLALGRQKIRIELSNSSGLATVHTQEASTRQFRLVDISPLSRWKLRFFTTAYTSSGFPADVVQLRLHRMQASSVEGSTSVVGWVVDALTNRPLPNAAIRTKTGQFRSLSNAEGMYILQLDSGTTQIEATLGEYEQVTKPLAVKLASGEQVVQRILMRKTKLGFGDVVHSAPCPKEPIYAMAVTPSHIEYTAKAGEKTGLYRMGLDGKGVTLVCQLPIGNTGLVHRNGALYGVEYWPGRLYRIDAKAGQVEDVHRLGVNWPHGLAFDGKHFWYTEKGRIENRFGLYAVDAETRETICHLESGDTRIRGVAWGNERLWVSSLSGQVYEIDPARARKTGRMETGILRRFPGTYQHLSFAAGDLWGLDTEAGRICRITVGNDAPHAKTNRLVNVALKKHNAVATADSVGKYMSFTGSPDRAIDGQYIGLTGWRGTKIPGWLQVEFNRVYTIRKIGICFGSHQHVYSVTLSRDGSTWQVVVPDRLSHSPEGGPEACAVYTINPTEAKFIRIDVKKTSAPGGHAFQATVIELEAYAEVPSVDENLGSQ